MSGPVNEKIVDRDKFIDISSHSIRRLRSEKLASKFSKNKLKDIKIKIKDLRSSKLDNRGRQELMFEISRDITDLNGSKKSLRVDQLEFFTGVMEKYKDLYPSTFEALSEKPGLMAEYAKEFEILELLQKDESKSVWKVMNKETSDESQLTVYPITGKLDSEKLLNSFSSWTRLEHPDIQRLRGVHIKRKSYAVESEVTGTITLADFISGTDSRAALFAAYQISEGLQYAHSIGVCHPALSPYSVIVSDKWGMKISDWNISTGQMSEGSGIMHIKDVARSYLPPELLTEENNMPGETSDVYSLCRITLDLLTGGDSAGKDIEKINMDNTLRSMLKFGLSEDPDKRVTITQFAQTLGKILNTDKTSTPETLTSIESGSTAPSEMVKGKRDNQGENAAASGNNITENGFHGDEASSERIPDDPVRRTAAEIRSLVPEAKYEPILHLIEKNENEIFQRYPNLRDNVKQIELSLKAVVKIPMALSKNEIEVKLLDFARMLEG